MVCPNISSQEWKSAVEKFGVEGALAEFVYNGFELPAEIDLSNEYTRLNKNGNKVFDRQKTLQMLSNDPELVNDIVKSLRDLEPSSDISVSKLIKNRPDDKNFTIEEVKNALYNLPTLQVNPNDSNTYIAVDNEGNQIGEPIPRVSTLKNKPDDTEVMRKAANRGTIIDDMVREAVVEFNKTGKKLSANDFWNIYKAHPQKENTDKFNKDFVEQLAEIINNDVLTIEGLTLLSDIPTLQGRLRNPETGEIGTYAGTVDLIGYDKNGNFYLIDLKTSSMDRFKEYKGFDKYDYQGQDAIQLASYMELLKQITGKDFKASILPIHTQQDKSSKRYNAAEIKRNTDGKVLLENSIIPIKKKEVTPIENADIPPGENGMHYQNAFLSAVSWANSDAITPPFEYVEFYLNDLRGNPLVRELTLKHGSLANLERVIKRHGRGEEVSKSTEKKMGEFWNMIKDFYGNPEIKDMLQTKVNQIEAFDTFSPDNSLAKNIDEAYKQAMNYNTGGYLNVDGTGIPKQRINKQTKKDATDLVYNNIYGKEGTTTPAKFVQRVNDFIDRYNKMKEQDSTERAELPVLNKTYIDVVRSIVNNSDIEVPANFGDVTLSEEIKKVQDESRRDGYLEDLMSDVKAVLKNEQVEIKNPVSANMIVKFLTMANIQIDHFATFQSGVIVDDNHYVPLRVYNDLIEAEFNNEKRKRKEFLSNKPKWVGKVYNWLESGGILLSGPRQHALFLTGSTDSNFSKLHSKALNQAESKRTDILNKFEDIVAVGNWEEHKNGSIFLTGQEDVSKLKGLDFTFKLRGGPDAGSINVKLTDSEILNLYMIARQDTAELDEHVSPKQALLDQGFALDPEDIEKRGVLTTDYMDITESQLERVKEYVEANYSDFVTKIDNAMEMMHSNVTKTHYMMNGFQLGKRKNYFPLRHAGTKSFKFNEKRRLISELSSTHMRPGGTKPFLIQDVNKTLQQHKLAGALYSSYTIPLYNGTKVLNNLLKKYQDDKEVTKYLSAIDAHYKRIGNVGVSVSRLDTERKITKTLNKLTGAFSAGVLGLNVGVQAKQSVSLVLAKTYIDNKYLREAGMGVGGIVGVNPKEVFKNLDVMGKEGKPLTWQFDENDPVYQRLVRLSPKMYYRLKGNSSRETNEAFLESAKDDIALKLGKFEVSKKRMMEGIRVVDAATILTIFKAVELEAQDKYKLKPGTAEFDRFVKNKTEMVVDLTQPTYDINNRSYLHSMEDPFIRMFTLFGSARSKIGMQYLESFYNYLHNPSAENKKKFLKMNVNAIMVTSLMISAINLAQAGIFGGPLDDEDYDTFQRDLIMNTTAGFFGLSDITRLLVTRLDNAPWSGNLEHPFQALVEGTADGVVAVANGDIDRAIQKLSFSLMASKGLPYAAVSYPRKVINGWVMDND